MLAAVAFVTILAGLGAFQVALALGAPLGRFAYGGQHEREIPTPLRITSAIAFFVYAVIAVFTLDRAGTIDLLPGRVSRPGMWVIVVALFLMTVPNAISRSRPERYVMTPVTLALALLALVVARS